MIDYMFIGLVVFFAIMGLVSGILIEGLRVILAAVAIGVTLKYAPVIADSVTIFQRSEMLRDYGLPVLMFGVLYMLMALIMKLLVGMVSHDKKGPSPASRLFGLVAGVVLGAMLAYFIVSVGLTAQDSSGRKMVALSNGKSRFVEFVSEHRLGTLTGPSGRQEMEVKVKEAAESIRDGIRESRSQGAAPDAGTAPDAAPADTRTK